QIFIVSRERAALLSELPQAPPVMCCPVGRMMEIGFTTPPIDRANGRSGGRRFPTACLPQSRLMAATLRENLQTAGTYTTPRDRVERDYSACWLQVEPRRPSFRI